MNEHSPYPLAMGNEEETSFRYLPGRFADKEELNQALRKYRQSQNAHNGVEYRGMDSTGGRIYVDRNQFEIASPEYTLPSELATRIQSNEIVIENVAEILLEQREMQGAVGMNRRNADSMGHTFACQDNFAITGGGSKAEVEEKLRDLLVPFAMSRGIFCGAGYCHDSGYFFSQKAFATRSAVSTYDYTNKSFFRASRDEGTTRVEFRSNDTNISWDATRRRIGLNAIALSIAQTHLSQQFTSIMEQARDTRASSFAFNYVPVDEYGEFVISEQTAIVYKATSFIMELCEVFMSDDMKTYGDQPGELMAIASESYRYGEAMMNVLAGREPVELLASSFGSDWAAKLMLIGRSLQKSGPDEELGFGSSRARLHDLRYDYKELRATEDRYGKDGVIMVVTGSGYKLRDDKKFFPTHVEPESVRESGLRAPRATRASLRAQLVRDYELTRCSWSDINVASSTDPNSIPVRINLNNVLKTELTKTELTELKNRGLAKRHREQGYRLPKRSKM